MNFMELLGLGLIAVLVFYVAARLASAAYFKSKQTYENERENQNDQ